MIDNFFINKCAADFEIPLQTIQKMYNPEIKAHFIYDEYQDNEPETISAVVNFFTLIADYEEKESKDLMNFDMAAIEGVFKYLRVATTATFYNRKALIKKYLMWCIDKRYVKIDILKYFDDLTYDKIITKDNIRLKFFKDIDDLLACINAIVEKYNPYDIHQYDIVITTLLLNWCGLELKEIVKLPISSLNFDKNEIVLKNMVYKMPEKVSKFIKNYLDESDYTVSVGLRNHFNKYWKNTGLVLRATNSMQSDYYSMSGLQSKISLWFRTKVVELDNSNYYKYHSLYLVDIQRSGQFDRLYKYEQKYSVSIDDIKKEIFLKIVCKKTLDNNTMLKIKADYKNWRRVFYGI